MNAKELRMNNLVLFNGNLIMKVYQIEHRHNEVYRVNDIDNNSFLSPIPLTEEWLIRAGFSQSYSSDPQEPNASEMFKKDKFTLHLPSGILPFIYQPFDGDLIEIRYLHQLQNIYCTLTGIELEFTKDI